MKARQRLINGSYNPDQLKVLTKAFDDAWEQIAQAVGRRPQAIEAARLKLADIILGLSSNGTQDGAQMTEAALRQMFQPPTEL